MKKRKKNEREHKVEGGALSRRGFLRNAALSGAAGAAAYYGTRPMAAAGAAGKGGSAGSGSSVDETLHNGIKIPRSWPPREMDPHSREPMPVPYLYERPGLIPIDTGRQLFVDDFLIESSTLERRFHQPKRYLGNPVLFPETSDELEPTAEEEHRGLRSERAVCYLGHGGVFFDPADKLFKMFYTASWRGGLAMATSRDGIRWDRPDLGMAGGNLILKPGDDYAGGDNCVWLDTQTENSAERYKYMTTRGRDENRDFIHTLHTSPDGLKWSEGVRTGPASDYCSFYFDPFRKVWVYSIKQNGPRGRCRYYAEHPDFMEGAKWENSAYWMNADRLDRPDPRVGDSTQLYSHNAVAYESLQVGVFYIHRGPINRICEEGRFPKYTDLALGFSRDGFHWDRPDRRPFLAGTRLDGDWDRAYLHGTAGVCMVVGDHLYFPYTGYSGIDPGGFRGMYTGAAVGMAMLRRDGFASMEARQRDGVLTTRPLTFKGNKLFVNVDCPLGELRVEVLDRGGRLVEPFTAENCESLTVNSTLKEIRWKGENDLEKVAGEPVRLRFRLKNGALYSFWVTPSSDGASYGYVGAGGPGLSGATDTEGRKAYPEARNLKSEWRSQIYRKGQIDS